MRTRTAHDLFFNEAPADEQARPFLSYPWSKIGDDYSNQDDNYDLYEAQMYAPPASDRVDRMEELLGHGRTERLTVIDKNGTQTTLAKSEDSFGLGLPNVIYCIVTLTSGEAHPSFCYLDAQGKELQVTGYTEYREYVDAGLLVDALLDRIENVILGIREVILQ